MTTLELRTEITRLLRKEKNTSVLEAIRLLLRRSDHGAGDELTEVEVEAFDRQIQDMESGKVSAHSRKASMAIVRGQRKA